ncbi:sigma-70 family RNA polymerase sigma factor [Arthrobacter sp. H14]|uniref:sigma-70 family RNA polymerase sigma factor n=1 Tax=Arthrobacter sp. H14 TaxID=1312959 RepID=UPI00047EBAC5|nr:sigma-70 family RNA polymerase sigma factor [Arthrobacter sp. H14]
MSMDSEAVMRLYREHGPALRRFAASATSNPDQAEDIVQESILRVWQHAPERTTNMRGYLFRTARNVIIDNYRRRTHRPVEAGPDHLDDNFYSDGVDELLLKLTMEEALGSLSPEHRGVIVALHYRGLTVAQTAELLQIPAGTVKSRAYYGLRELREALSGMGVMS